MELDAHTHDFMQRPANISQADVIKHSGVGGVVKSFILANIRNERNFYENSENNSAYCRGKIKALKELYYNIFKEEVM
ncbi:MAG: hypothetical protein [Caudoviricetes sp.]|nr:MAG: hypothetical protein [Caudoviricetes sp.]